MTYAGKISLIVAAAGVALGALLGDAANPVPKHPPQQWWQGNGPEVFTAASPDVANPWSEEIGFADSYRPDLDYDTMITSYWEPPADWHWYGEDEPTVIAFTEETEMEAAPLDAAEDAADRAVEVAGAAASEVEAAPAPVEPRPAPDAPLTSEGLY